MNFSLSTAQLRDLFRTVFAPQASDRVITFIVDVPSKDVPDSREWYERRAMAHDWAGKTRAFREELGLDRVLLFYYENVGRANADLPAWMYRWEHEPFQLNAYILGKEGSPVSLDEILTQTDLIVAPTEFSATAPLKIAAPKYRFRGATMPGFTAAMIPSLGIDYARVNEIIISFKRRLDEAESADMLFASRGREFPFHADLRRRQATASSGLFHKPGIVGNLPSGEAYIVPYEGELKGEPSLTAGLLPVQFGSEIVIYRIEGNRAVAVESSGAESAREAAFLREEPAYGNIAEIGFGILGKFGCSAAGNLLMDEKLGLHIAFGRSEHFGGNVSPSAFRNPKNVLHIDRVYVPSLQPDVAVRHVTLNYPGKSETVMRENEWVV